MDRRRFAPTALELEARQLLSTLGKLTGSAATDTANANSFQARAVRIENLPRLFNSVQNQAVKRFLPADTVMNIQNDLRSIEGQLHIPSADSKLAFEKTLRSALRQPTLSRTEALTLTHAFTDILASAGATDAQIYNFQFDTTDLLSSDAKGVMPTTLATDDVSILFQTAVAVGRPLYAPSAPTLLPASDTGIKGDHITTIRQPFLTGSYEPNATIQIVDGSGNVLGTTTTNATTGQYSVQFASPLPDGKFKFRVRATIENASSEPSPTITLKITSKPVGKSK